MNRSFLITNVIALLIVVIFCGQVLSQEMFYSEYWAEYDSTITEKNSNHWRINDESVSLHERYGPRTETKSNGLLMIPIEEDLFLLDKTELCLEMWGGHIKTEHKRFYVNGRGPYYLPRTGVEEGYYSYSNPTIYLQTQHLVRGKNAFQFTVDKAGAGWGHYIVKEAALRCYLKKDHPDLTTDGIDRFKAVVRVGSKNGFLTDISSVVLNYEEGFRSKIDSVVYFARYAGFDDKGLGKDNYWHGMTVRRKFVNHVGSSCRPPYQVDWDTEMLPDQPGPMEIRAIVYLKKGIRYQTEPSANLLFAEDRNTVRMYKCEPFPPFFGSRMSREKTAYITIPDNIANIQKAQLVIKNWGRHHGHNKDPFKFNDLPYDLFSEVVSRLLAFSRINVSTGDLLPGKNTFSVFSDTEHHSLEMFLPGPVLIVKEKRKK